MINLTVSDSTPQKTIYINARPILTIKQCDIYFPDVLCFDNTFSWTRSKKIKYSCEVIAPDDDLIKQEINKLIDDCDWETLSDKFQITHL